MEGSFREEDREKFIEFLNFIAKKAKLKSMSVEETIKFYGLLSHMQQVLLPKINDHILEVKRVVEPEKPKRGRPKKET